MKTKLKLPSWIEEKIAEEKKLASRLERKYSRRQTDPRNIPAYKLSAEWNELRQLLGTVLMRGKIRERWLIVDKAHSSMLAHESSYPY